MRIGEKKKGSCIWMKVKQFFKITRFKLMKVPILLTLKFYCFIEYI
jgi:hypothetical protein